MEIIKVRPGFVLIQLDGEKVSKGELLRVFDSNGKEKSFIRVTSFNQTKAVARIESGSANVGMTAIKRHDTSADHYNLRLNPIGLIAGAINGDFEFKISDEWTVGIQGAFIRAKLSPTGIFNSDYNITAWGIGARADWYFNGVFNDGFYLGPSAEYLNVNVKTSDSFGPASGNAAGLMLACILGYGWFWDNGFNIMLGGGYGGVLGASGITIQDSVGNRQAITANLSGLTYELSFGWAF